MKNRENTVSTELMVFWFTSFGVEKSSFPIGHWGIAKPTHTIIHSLWEASFTALQMCDYEVLMGVCDGASENPGGSSRTSSPT